VLTDDEVDEQTGKSVIEFAQFIFFFFLIN
jgi:hypothetical protein